MEIEKTTILSILVGAAGLLAELVFHETLTGSILGVVLSVVLAVIILCCTYFAIDGLQKSFSAAHKREENRKREYDEKLFRLLNKKLSDQIKLEKGIYSLLAKEAKKDSPMSGGIAGSGDYWKELAESIDNSSLKAAKLVVKYNQKNQEESDRISGQNAEEMLQAIRSMGNQLQMLNGGLQDLATRVVAMVEESASRAEEESEPAETVSAMPELEENQQQSGKSIDELLQAAGEEFFQSPEDSQEKDSLWQETEALVQDDTQEDVLSLQGADEPDFPLSEEGRETLEPDALLSEEADVLSEQEADGEDAALPGEEVSDIIAGQSMGLQGVEDVDVNRMMEELFNESLEAESEDAAVSSDSGTVLEGDGEDADTGFLPEPDAGDMEEPEEDVILSAGLDGIANLDMETVLMEGDGSIDLDVEPAPEQEDSAEPDMVAVPMEENSSKEPDMEAVPMEENSSKEIDMEAVLAAMTDSNDIDEDSLLEEAVSDTEEMSEEDLDSLLSGLLPEPEPLEEATEEPESIQEETQEEPESVQEKIPEKPEEKTERPTALDMLLNHQKAERKQPEPKEEPKPTEIPEPVSESKETSGFASERTETQEPSEIAEPAEDVEAAETAEQTETPVSAEDAGDSNKAMTPDDIAALLASIDS